MEAQEIIASYLADLRKQSRTDNTIKARRRTLRVLAEELPYGLAATAEELETWLWREGISTSSRETYYSAMASFYDWAVETELMDYNPTSAIKRPKGPTRRLPRPVTDEQLRDILSRATEPYLTWTKLAAYAGTRCIEIARMDRGDITAKTTTVWRGKGDKPRVVGTHPVVWDAVKDLPPGPITDRDPQQISIGAWQYYRTLGHEVSLHKFRHWFGTTLQKLYKDLRVTQEAMGHADPRTTAGYALVAAEQVGEAIAMLPSFGSADAA